MSSPTIMLRLPARRHDQMRSLSTALNLSLADTVAHLLRKEIAAGTIPDAIPGIVITNVDRGVSITVDDEAPAVYSSTAARELANTIRDVVAGGAGIVSVQHRFAVLRQGTGFKIQMPFPSAGTAFTGDLARDLADLIEKAAG